MTRLNTKERGEPCTACGAPTVKEISVSEVCTGCGTYVEDCACTPAFGNAESDAKGDA